MNPTSFSRNKAFTTIELAIAGSFLFTLLLLVAVIVGMYFSYSNTEIRLRNTIMAKQKDNQSELDNLQKKINQSGQVTKAQTDALKEIIVGNSQARTSNGAGQLATLVKEAVPNVDTKIFGQLMNIIASSRDSFTMRQKEILDLKREHDNCRLVAPSSWICGGRPEIVVVVVTSERAEESFRTGQDNNTNVF